MSKSDCEMIDIEQIFQSREAEDSFLQRLSTYASESRLKIKTSIQQCLAKRKGKALMCLYVSMYI